MEDLLKNFPVLGDTCSAALSAVAKSDENWILTDIETLSRIENNVLGDLWKMVKRGPVTITTFVLCAALELASQVVALDVKLAKIPTKELFIDDGLLVEYRLD